MVFGGCISIERYFFFCSPGEPVQMVLDGAGDFGGSCISAAEYDASYQEIDSNNEFSPLFFV